MTAREILKPTEWSYTQLKYKYRDCLHFNLEGACNALTNLNNLDKDSNLPGIAEENLVLA